MNLLRKMEKSYSNYKLAVILLFFLFNGLAMTQTDTSGLFVFVIDKSSRMESKSFSTSLTIANMIEKGISNRLKDGDVIMVWTYGDKVDTTAFEPVVWKNQEARNISNKIFMNLRNLKYSRNKLKSLSLNYLSSFLDVKQSATIYFVSDGGKPIDGIPFGSLFIRISQQNYERWKKEKIPCLTAIVLENGKITDWAIGEATPSGTVKTIAIMEKKVKQIAENKQPSQATNEKPAVKSIETKETQKLLVQKTNELTKIDVRTNVVSNVAPILKQTELKADSKPLIEKREETNSFLINKVPTKKVTNIVNNDTKVLATNRLSKDKITNSVETLNSLLANKNAVKTTNEILNSSTKINTSVNKISQIALKDSQTVVSQDSNKSTKGELVGLTNAIQQVISPNDNSNWVSEKNDAVIGNTNNVGKVVNLTVTQNIEALPDTVKKSEYSLLRLAIIFGLTACILWCFGYLKYRRSHRHSLITRGMNKGRFYKQ